MGDGESAGFEVQGLGFRVQGSGFRVQGSGDGGGFAAIIYKAMPAGAQLYVAVSVPSA